MPVIIEASVAHFTDEESEAQRGKESYSEGHS